MAYPPDPVEITAKSNTPDSAAIEAENGSTMPKEREEQHTAAKPLATRLLYRLLVIAMPWRFKKHVLFALMRRGEVKSVCLEDEEGRRW